MVLLGSITLLERVSFMRTYAFAVAIASDSLDTEVVEDTIKQALADGLPEDTLVVVKAEGIKDYSEQGWKVARSRKFGVSVKEAGDGHKAKTSKVEVEAVALT
jgi:hypothetical protein